MDDLLARNPASKEYRNWYDLHSGMINGLAISLANAGVNWKSVVTASKDAAWIEAASVPAGLDRKDSTVQKIFGTARRDSQAPDGPQAATRSFILAPTSLSVDIYDRVGLAPVVSRSQILVTLEKLYLFASAKNLRRLALFGARFQRQTLRSLQVVNRNISKPPAVTRKDTVTRPALPATSQKPEVASPPTMFKSPSKSIGASPPTSTPPPSTPSPVESKDQFPRQLLLVARLLVGKVLILMKNDLDTDPTKHFIGRVDLALRFLVSCS